MLGALWEWTERWLEARGEELGGVQEEQPAAAEAVVQEVEGPVVPVAEVEGGEGGEGGEPL